MNIDLVLQKEVNPYPNQPPESVIPFVGYQNNTVKRLFYWLGCICSLGFLWLLTRWIPSLYTKLNCDRVPLKVATRVCLKGHFKELTDVQIETNQAFIRMGSPKYFVSRFQVWRWHNDVLDHPACSKYRPVQYPFEVPIPELHNKFENRILHEETAPLKSYLYGQNLIDVPVPNPFQLLIDEVLHPFYLFQLFSVTVWFIEVYWQYSVTIIIMSVTSAVVGVYQTRKNLKNIKALAEYRCEVFLYKEGEARPASSTVLIPGDVIEIRQGLVMPCDVVLLSGQAILNEAMLTGESVPVVKAALVVENQEVYQINKHSKYTLYGGTEVLQVKQTSQEPVLGMVIQTGFSTTKGELVRSILYPKPLNMKFYRDSFYFIGFLVLCATVGFGLMIFRFRQLGVSWGDIVLKGCDLFTISIPPALPIALTVGVVFAVDRLKRVQRISCISPQRVTLAGLVDIFCFDKTGTLTADGLDVMELRGTTQGDPFEEASPDQVQPHFTEPAMHPPDVPRTLLKVASTCHSLARLGETYIGDSLEVKMFLFTGWEFHESENGYYKGSSGVSCVIKTPPNFPYDEELGLLKQFDFSSDTQRMSTFVKDFNSGQIFLCCKGAPEVIATLCLPQSLPPNFQEVLMNYTKCGFRVLGCGIRYFAEPLTDGDLAKFTRQDAEQDLHFAGLLVMENKLKKETIPALKILNKAEIGSTMVTGDNPLTAGFIANTCGISDAEKPLYFSEIIEGKGIMWKNIFNEDEPLRELDEVAPPNFAGKKLPVELAVTGLAFEKLLAHSDTGDYARVLKYASIYARMKPNQKQQLVESLAETGFTVGMCGDGANDCGALKAADVGISLSEAEASIAAPFTSGTPNIGCVVSLLREGRCALVTSFQAFKFMASYSFIQFFCQMILYAFYMMLSGFEFLWMDLFIVLPLAFSSEYTGAYKHLTARKPITSLMSWNVITSLLFQNAINFVFQLGTLILLYQQSWFTPLIIDPESNNSQCAEVTSVFLVANYQYVFSVLAYSVGKPFRKPFYTTIVFDINIILALIGNTWILFYPPALVSEYLMLVDIPWDWKWTLFGLAAANSVLVLIVEQIHSWLFVSKDICNDQKNIGKNSLSTKK